MMSVWLLTVLSDNVLAFGVRMVSPYLLVFLSSLPLPKVRLLEFHLWRATCLPSISLPRDLV